MFFRNLHIYRLPASFDITAGEFEAALSESPLLPCGSMDMVSRGWLHARNVSFVHAVNAHWLIALGVEEKILPAAVVRRMADERAFDIEVEQERKVGRKELRDIRERITEELLPRALAKRRATWCWIDPVGRWLVIDTGSDTRADEFVEMLQKSLDDGIALRPLQTQHSPTSAMTDWMASGEAPAGFSIDDTLELRSSAESQSAIRYVNHDLEGGDIRQHIASGKLATKLAMTWNDRISFVLNGRMQIKRLAFLDILKDQAEQDAQTANEQFDVDFTLMAGELSRMLVDVVAALGGEVVAA